MRLGTIEIGGTTSAVVGVSDGEAAVVDHYPDVAALITGGGAAQMAIAAAVSRGTRVALRGIDWRPPVLRPGKVLAIALNNSANPDRIMRGPDHPAGFIKPASSLIGSGTPIRLRREYGRVHPEPELAVVIGAGGADIPESDAYEHVFGYTIINDLTSPSMRGDDTFHYRAIHPDPSAADGIAYVDSWVSYPARYKGADTFGPIGPWVVTADEIPDPHALRITCSHDGRLITDDSTANLRFSVAEVIAFMSRTMSFEAGDIIAMGTALKRSARGGAVQNVDLTTLGGVIEVAIEGIGTLSNPVERR
jgi:2-keto-4-pentenoate hydratase/2-oxohepta-3-ene-1,7-dioic acid hydratase in catechol pathway